MCPLFRLPLPLLLPPSSFHPCFTGDNSCATLHAKDVTPRSFLSPRRSSSPTCFISLSPFPCPRCHRLRIVSTVSFPATTHSPFLVITRHESWRRRFARSSPFHLNLSSSEDPRGENDLREPIAMHHPVKPRTRSSQAGHYYSPPHQRRGFDLSARKGRLSVL